MAVWVKAEDAERQDELKETYPDAPIFSDMPNHCGAKWRPDRGQPFSAWTCTRRSGHGGRHVAHVKVEGSLASLNRYGYKHADIVGYWMPDEGRG